MSDSQLAFTIIGIITVVVLVLVGLGTLVNRVVDSAPIQTPTTFYVQSEGGEPRSVITTSTTWTTAEGVTFRVNDDGKLVIKVEEKR